MSRGSLPLRLSLISMGFALVVTALLVTVGAVLLYQQHQRQAEHSGRDAARDLAQRAEQLVGLGLSLPDLMGFEEQCEAVLPRNGLLQSAAVFDAQRNGLYANAGGPPVWPVALKDAAAPSAEGWLLHPIRRGDKATVGWVLVAVDPQRVLANTLQQVGWLVGLAGLLFVGGLLVQQVLFWRTVGRPLADLVTTADGLDRGLPTTLPPVASDDDIGRVHAALHRLVERLQAAQSQLRADNERLEFMVAERTQRLNEANAALQRDLDRREELEAELRRMAHTDALTGLSSRGFFRAHAEARVEAARRQRHVLVFYLFDLDRFKRINDTHGHAVGDRVLVEAAQRVRQMARGADVVARIGGDEFVLMCEGPSEVGEAGALAQRLVDLFRAPFVVDGLVLEVGVSVGVAAFPQHGADLTAVLSAADAAMYAAKQRGGGWCHANAAWMPQLVGGGAPSATG